MLVNPYRAEENECLATYPGTRLIQDTMGLLGHRLFDPMDPARAWTIEGLYLPVLGRRLGGIRAKVSDQKQFVAFLNQRDLEVLLDLASPGNYCYWLDQDYVEPGSSEWIGFCMDEEDLLDDLYDRELELRAGFPDGAPLPTGMEMVRRIHLDVGNDAEELLHLLGDMNMLTGAYPDTRYQTIGKRWVPVERTPRHLRHRLWERLQ